MKTRNVKRCLAALTSCLVLASGTAAMPFTATAATNIITNSTFDSGTYDWAIYRESGGKATLSTEDGKLAMNVTAVGTKNYAVQLNYDIIPLYENGVYHFSYEISSTADRDVEAMIQQNGGTYQSYTWKGLNLTSEPQVVDYEFTMTKETDIMSKMVFNCGFREGEDLGEHTIYLDNVVLTPHIAGAVTNGQRRIAKHVCEELERFLSGEPMRTQVDFSKLSSMA